MSTLMLCLYQVAANVQAGGLLLQLTGASISQVFEMQLPATAQNLFTGGVLLKHMGMFKCCH